MRRIRLCATRGKKFGDYLVQSCANQEFTNDFPISENKTFCSTCHRLVSNWKGSFEGPNLGVGESSGSGVAPTECPNTHTHTHTTFNIFPHKPLLYPLLFGCKFNVKLWPLVWPHLVSQGWPRLRRIKTWYKSKCQLHIPILFVYQL